MSHENSPPTREAMVDAIGRARVEGFIVHRGTPRTLLLDLDTEAAKAQFHRVFETLAQMYDVTGVSMWASKSGNLHVRVGVKAAMSVTTRLALQASMGSDGIREILAHYRHVYEGVDEPSLLFRPPTSVVYPYRPGNLCHKCFKKTPADVMGDDGLCPTCAFLQMPDEVSA